jgi:hypothetical protein
MSTQIDLEFSTWAEDGLILWQGHRDVGWGMENPNYVAVGRKSNNTNTLSTVCNVSVLLSLPSVTDGYLTFSVNDVTVRSTRRVNDGVAHKATLRMNQQQLGLSVGAGSGVFKMLTPPLDSEEIKEFDIQLG